MYLGFLISPVGYLSKNVPKGSANKVHFIAAFLFSKATVLVALTMGVSSLLPRKEIHGKPQKLCESVQIRKNPWGWLNTQAQGCNRWLPCVSRKGEEPNSLTLSWGRGVFGKRQVVIGALDESICDN